MTPRSLIVSAGLAALFVNPALADDRFWLNPAGGAFSSGANWSDGLVPGPGDFALFDIAATYAVGFTGPQVVFGFVVNNGRVAFSNGATLHCPPWGAVIGWADGQTAELDLNAAALDGDSTWVGAAGGTGILDMAAGSTWTMPNDINVGVDGTSTGIVTVRQGSQLHTRFGTVGGQATGTLTVTGAGSAWTMSENVIVGSEGMGTLIIADGGHVSNSWAEIGSAATAVGHVDVNSSVAPGARWDCGATLVIGSLGDGSMDVASGGVVTNADWSSTGDGVGSHGSVVVANDARWENAVQMWLGFQGDATLDISTRGVVTNTWCSMAETGSGTAVATVRDAGSRWDQTDSLRIGTDGNATLNVEDGATKTNTWTVIAESFTSQSAAHVSGGVWTMSDALVVGRRGIADLSINGGGAVSNAWSTIAELAGSSAHVTLDGIGSTWDLNDLRTGYLGDGNLTVSGGAAMTGTWHVVAAEPESTGSVMVTDSDSSMTQSDMFTVGDAGSGIASVLNGGMISNTWSVVGNQAGAHGQVTVQGAGSRWDCSDSLQIGAAGIGSVALLQGGNLQASAWTIVATTAGSNGTVLVDGSGSQWQSFGTLEVGRAGAGLFEVRNLGSALVLGTCSIGEVVGGTGELKVTSASFSDGGTLSVGNGTGTSGFVTLSSATLSAPAANINVGGTLRGAGTLQALTANAGAVRPGFTVGSSHVAGLLTIDGAYAQSSGGLFATTLMGTGAGQIDKIACTGAASLNGRLNITTSGFTPTLGQSFQILSSPAVSGTFSAVSGAGLGSGRAFEVQYSGTAVTLVVKSATSVAITSTSSDLYLGFTHPLTATASLSPSGSVNVLSSATWSSDSTTIATVDADGVVTARALGSTTIRVNFQGLTAALPVTVHSVPDPTDTIRVSISDSEQQANGASSYVSISADGHLVCFHSAASNLVTGDTNGEEDCFVRDISAGTTQRVSVSSTGAQGNGRSDTPQMTPDGRFVVFRSDATNLVASDANAAGDIFVRDRQTGATTLVSVSSTGAQGNNSSFDAAISADGRYVAFTSFADNLIANDVGNHADVFVRDRQTGVTQVVSVSSSGVQGDSDSGAARITPDGRYVLFVSGATNLVAGDTNAATDYFVHDRVAHTTQRVSVSAAGAETSGNGSLQPGCGISADGRYIVFESQASNVAAGDTNNSFDIFLRDRTAGTTTRISTDASGAQLNGNSFRPAITPDGTKVVFYTLARNITGGPTNGRRHVVVKDLQTGTLQYVTHNLMGDEANNENSQGEIPAISADGRYVAYTSLADNLAAFDTNGAADVFRFDRGEPGCVADFDDGSGTGTRDGGVTIDDLLYFLFLFAQGDIAADIDDGSGTGTHDQGVTIDDLLFFLVHFAAGC